MSDRWAPLRDGLFLYAQSAMLGGLLILVLISLGSKVASDVPNVLAFGGITLLASALAFLPPWHRLPRGSLIAVAVVDVLILAMLET